MVLPVMFIWLRMRPPMFRHTQRQRLIACRQRRIERARQEHREGARIADAAGHSRRLGAGAEIDIGARRPDDRRPGILGEDETAKFRRRFFVGDRQIGANEERRAVHVQRTIHRD